MASKDMEKQPLLASQQHSQPQPSLSDLQQRVFAAQREYIKAWSKTTSGKWHRRIMVGTTAILLIFMAFCLTVIAQDSLTEDDGGWMLDGRVPLEAHIMSKCPDARDCLHDLVLPAMQQMSSKVDFKLSYIGKETGHDDGVACMHGQEECLGNLIELCAARLYPDPKIYLGFTMCLSKEYADIPKRTLVEDCALEHGIDMSKVNGCTADDEGSIAFDLLKESFRRSEAANVTTSCTIRLNNEVRCIRDSGKWKDCEGGSSVQDLVRDIRDLYNAY